MVFSFAGMSDIVLNTLFWLGMVKDFVTVNTRTSACAEHSNKEKEIELSNMPFNRIATEVIFLISGKAFP